MAALGTWTGMLFSEEMDNAAKFGYKFKILSGYTFERGNIFREYIDMLYQMRLNYPKSDPMNLIAKLQMNSTYGRFAMDDNFDDINVMSNESYNEWESESVASIKDVLDLGEHKVVMSQHPDVARDRILDAQHDRHTVNIAVASAVTAYARIHMSQFKNNPDYNLYYSDTDSIYIDKPLPDNLISDTELGKLKLENIAKRAIFLGPKFYALDLEKGDLIVKVKGLTKSVPLTFEDLETLLYKDTKLEKEQEKWFKSLTAGSISIKDQLYTLKVTSNKRKLLYTAEDNKLYATVPYTLPLPQPSNSLIDLVMSTPDSVQHE